MLGKGSLQLTGKLGEVIRYSTSIALSCAKAHGYELGLDSSPNNLFLAGYDANGHVQESTAGKKGSTSGTALLVAFLSLLKGVSVDRDISSVFFLPMSLSLVSESLWRSNRRDFAFGVCELKAKVVVGDCTEIKTIVTPGAARADGEESVPDSVKEFIDVEDVEEVFKICGSWRRRLAERERRTRRPAVMMINVQ
jgi:ATP-dependent Lon protease